MRIVGGELKSRVYHSRSFKGRPTMDRAKEALFNILTNRFDFARIVVADLFSGTGGIAFEFASRGVPSITCVEWNPRYAAEIERNAAILGVEGLTVLRADVLRFLDGTNAFDLIFADPPYAMRGIEQLPERMLVSGVLKPGGLVIIEHGAGQQFADAAPFEQRSYGESTFSFFRREGL